MKKIILCLFVTSFMMACDNTEKKSTEKLEQVSAKVEHIYQPTYSDNFKIGDQKNVLLAEQFHKAGFEKDFKQIEDLIADTAVFYNEDGTTLKGKPAILEYMKKSFMEITFKNYSIAAIIPVVGENGHQWVDIWDEAEIVTKDGKSQKYQWVDAFRFENGKIVAFIGFGKGVKE